MVRVGCHGESKVAFRCLLRGKGLLTAQSSSTLLPVCVWSRSIKMLKFFSCSLLLRRLNHKLGWRKDYWAARPPVAELQQRIKDRVMAFEDNETKQKALQLSQTDEDGWTVVTKGGWWIFTCASSGLPYRLIYAYCAGAFLWLLSLDCLFVVCVTSPSYPSVTQFSRSKPARNRAETRCQGKGRGTAYGQERKKRVAELLPFSKSRSSEAECVY